MCHYDPYTLGLLSRNLEPPESSREHTVNHLTAYELADYKTLCAFLDGEIVE